MKYKRGMHPNSRNGFKKDYKSNKKGKTYEQIFGKEKGDKKRRNHSKKMKNIIFTDEHRRKIGEAHKGMKMPPKTEEYCRKRSEMFKGNKSHFWQNGKSYELYGDKFTRGLRKKIRKRDKFVCQSCGKNGWCVHHIDYNKKNNKENNLITLCNSCHMKTNFKRNDWIKYFKEMLKWI